MTNPLFSGLLGNDFRETLCLYLHGLRTLAVVLALLSLLPGNQVTFPFVISLTAMMVIGQYLFTFPLVPEKYPAPMQKFLVWLSYGVAPLLGNNPRHFGRLEYSKEISLKPQRRIFVSAIAILLFLGGAYSSSKALELVIDVNRETFLSGLFNRKRSNANSQEKKLEEQPPGPSEKSLPKDQIRPLEEQPPGPSEKSLPKDQIRPLEEQPPGPSEKSLPKDQIRPLEEDALAARPPETNVYNFPLTPSPPPQNNPSQRFNLPPGIPDSRRSNRKLVRLLLENNIKAQLTEGGVVIILRWLYERRADGQIYLQPTTQRKVMALATILAQEAAGHHITLSPRYPWQLSRDIRGSYVVEEMVERLLEILGEAGIRKEDITLFQGKTDVILGFVMLIEDKF